MKTLAVCAASGARTSLGGTLVETAFLLRTGIAAIAASPLADAEGEQVTMCFDKALDPYLVGEERAAELAAPALAEALSQLGEEGESLSLRLLLCLDAPRSPAVRGERGERGAQAASALVAQRLHARARDLSPGITLEVCARGSAGAAFALPQALEALASRQMDALVLGGVHTDYDPATIADLAAQGRLHGPKNLDAVIPGEAAAFVVLMREDTARRLRLEPAARISGIGSATARARPDNDESVFDARGLTTAVRAAAAELVTEQLRAGWLLTDHTFESSRILEWQTMATRAHALFGSPYHLESPAQRLGHLGAASLPLAIALAAEGWKRGYAPSAIAIALAGSEAGERGAIVLVSNV
jgi:3-oxoacyl-[acyl-carrier-protein] synthase-1